MQKILTMKEPVKITSKALAYFKLSHHDCYGKTLTNPEQLQLIEDTVMTLRSLQKELQKNDKMRSNQSNEVEKTATFLNFYDLIEAGGQKLNIDKVMSQF